MSPPALEPVGVVGLGAMGRPIAEHLLAAGRRVACADLDNHAVAALVGRGATAPGSLPALAAQAGVVLVLVPTDADVLAVCDPRQEGLLAGAAPGATLLICSSVRPETCRQVAALAGERGVAVLDAALTGGVRGAEAGQVNLLVGGDAATLERVRPVLAPWTKAVHHLGGLGAGQVGKTVNNLCLWAQVAAITEALTLGARLGVAPSRLRAALLDSPAGSTTLRELELMRLTWWAKDLDNAERIARDAGLELPVAGTVRAVMPAVTVERIAALLGGAGTVAPAAR